MSTRELCASALIALIKSSVDVDKLRTIMRKYSLNGKLYEVPDEKLANLHADLEALQGKKTERTFPVDFVALLGNAGIESDEFRQ
jgi:hypothetical protein